MRRFLLLSGSSYYPEGWDDYRGSFDVLEDAIAVGRERQDDWWNVVDSESEEVVAEGTRTRPTPEHTPSFMGPLPQTDMEKALEGVRRFNEIAGREVRIEMEGDSK